jgi:hypothetical protein
MLFSEFLSIFNGKKMEFQQEHSVFIKNERKSNMNLNLFKAFSAIREGKVCLSDGDCSCCLNNQSIYDSNHETYSESNVNDNENLSEDDDESSSELDGWEYELGEEEKIKANNEVYIKEINHSNIFLPI